MFNVFLNEEIHVQLEQSHPRLGQSVKWTDLAPNIDLRSSLPAEKMTSVASAKNRTSKRKMCSKTTNELDSVVNA